MKDRDWTEQEYRKAVFDDYFAAQQVDQADVTYAGYAPARELGFVASEMGLGYMREAVSWPGKAVDTLSQVVQHPLDTVQGVWAGLLDSASAGYAWATSDIPAQGIKRAIDEAQAKGPQGTGEFLFDATTGILTAELGGVAVKWVSGRWVASGAKEASTKNPNPTSALTDTEAGTTSAATNWIFEGRARAAAKKCKSRYGSINWASK